MAPPAETIWHEAECGGYAEDLALWEELAAAHGSPVLELGAGAGRVALHLARRGHDLDAVDIDAALVAAFNERAAAEGLRAGARAGDVRELEPRRRYPLVIAAMQLYQLLGGPAGRLAVLRSISAALAPSGVAGLAIVEGEVQGEAGPDTLPDVREEGGWVYSSLPLAVRATNGKLVVRRLRQRVSPAGELTEAEHEDVLDLLDARAVEAEARAVGLEPAGVRRIDESALHVGSAVVLLRREA